MFEIVSCGNTYCIRSKIPGAFENVVHAFGTRWTGDDVHTYAAHFHMDPDCFFTVTQIHGADILLLDDSEGEMIPRGEVCCDGIITNRRGLALGIRTADCVPLLLVDPVKRVVGAIHAGWRGTAREIAALAVRLFVRSFSSDPSGMYAMIGPSIGPCCYEVDRPVFQAMRRHRWSESVLTAGRNRGVWMLDLGKANRLQLIGAGVPDENIASIPLCTACRKDLFFSYRAEGNTGRQLSFIAGK